MNDEEVAQYIKFVENTQFISGRGRIQTLISLIEAEQLSTTLKVEKKKKVFTQLCPPLWTVACQAPLSWNSPGKNTAAGSHSLLQEIFSTQGLNPDLLHCSGFFAIWATREALLPLYCFLFHANILYIQPATVHKVEPWSSTFIFLLSTTDWHLPRTSANNWTTTARAFAICRCGDWTLCYCNCQPSGPPEGNSGWGVKYSVLQGNCWSRSLGSYFQELISWFQSLHHFMSRKSLNPFMVASAARD